MDGKTRAIVAHITWVGWLIAMIVNNEEKDELASYYLRQQLGLILTVICYSVGVFSIMMVVGLIPFVNILMGLLVLLLNVVVGVGSFVCWLISLLGAISGEEREIPWLGKYYQQWFHQL